VISLLLISAREGVREPAAVGFLERDLERSRQPDRRLPGIRGLGAFWAVIPEKFRFILFGTIPSTSSGGSPSRP